MPWMFDKLRTNQPPNSVLEWVVIFIAAELVALCTAVNAAQVSPEDQLAAVEARPGSS